MLKADTAGWAYWGTATAGSMVTIGYDGSLGNRVRIHRLGPDMAANTASIPTGAWTHVAITYKASTNTNDIYINGNYIESIVFPGNMTIPANPPLQIGIFNSTPSHACNMDIDEFRVWNTLRTPCEIQTYMSAEITSTATGLVHNFHFNQGIPSGSNAGTNTLLDASGAITGTLTNMALTGTVSNWVSPSSIANGYTTTGAPLATIALTGNGNNVPVGAITSTANNTDFGTNASRTFSIYNTGTGTLNINTIYFTGPHAAQFSVTNTPSNAVTSGTTGFVITLTPTNVGVSTTTVNIPSNDCTNPTFSFVITASTSPASALNFDGLDDYVNIPDDAALNMGSLITAEYWIKGNTSSNAVILEKGALNSNYHFQTTNSAMTAGGLHMLFGISMNNLTGRVVTSVPVIDGSWHHIAASFDDANNTLKIYVDGILSNSNFNATDAPVATSGPVQIGSRSGINAFAGQIDEVRIWNTLRTQCEIQTYMGAEITSTASGLVANYHFNEGIPSGANSAYSILTDAAGSNTGTLTSFALSGATSNWVSPGGVSNGFTTTSSPAASITISGNGNNIPMGVATTTANNTDFGTNASRTFSIYNAGTGTLNINTIYFSGPNAAQFSVTTIPLNAVTTATTGFVITLTPTNVGVSTATVYIPSNDCTNPTYSFVITASTSVASALAFDGADDYVDLGDTYNNLGDITMEAWINRPNTGTNGFDEIWSKELINSFSINNNTNKLHVNFGNGSSWGNHSESSAQIPYNTWVHIAASRNLSTGEVKLYINGVEEGTGNNSSSGSNTVPRAIGHKPGASFPFSAFDGTMDEVRVWNTVRTQCEIQTYMGAEITSTASGLLANYHFNEGIPSGSNSTYSLLTDAAGSNTGTLTSFALSGAASNWISPGGIANGYTTATAPGASLSLSGNGNNVPMGNSTSVSNNTDFGTNASRTFSIHNAGTGTLNINTIYFTGANASQFSVTTIPANSLTSGGSSFVITLTPTNTGISTATVNIPSNDCTHPTFSFVITASTSAASALNFDGGNDYIEGNNPLLPTGNTPRTIEAWFKPSLSQNGSIFNWGTSNSGATNQRSGLLYIGQKAYYVGQSNDLSGTVTINPGTWNHVAITYNGTLMNIYVNGLLDVSSTMPAMATTGTDFKIGTSLMAATLESFGGSIDEVRVWNTVRTQCEIQTYMSSEITSTASGLVANYHFNQGVPSGANITETLLLDAAGINNATLTNFALTTGTASNWVSPGGVANGFTNTSAPNVTLSLNGINDYGNSCENSPLAPSIYTIQNPGSDILYINSISLSGSPNYSLGTYAYSVAAASSVTFPVTLATSSVGVSTTTLMIRTNDCVTPEYTLAITGTVNPVPTITVNNYTTCAGISVTLTPAGAVSYTFEGGSDVVTPGITTTYTISGVNAFGCLSPLPATSSVTVNPNPIISINSGTICQGQSFILVPGGANSYTLSDVNGTVTTVVTPGTNTSYSVVGTSTDGCVSVNPAVTTISVDPIPTISVSSGSICAGQSYTIVPSGGYSYSLTDGANTYTTLSDLIVSPIINTDYTVTSTNIAGCLGSNTVISSVTVAPVPTITVSDYTMCANSSITLLPNGAVSYTYEGGTNVVSPGSTTSYTIAGTNSLGCVSPTVAVSNVTVYALPTVTVNSEIICVGQSATLIPSGANTFSMNGSQGSSFVVNPNITTSYSITGTSTAGCTNTVPVISSVTVFAAPVITVTDGIICDGQSFTITPSGANTYTYSSGSAIVSPTSTSAYTITGTSTVGCVGTATAICSVTVNPIPSINTNSGTICSGQTFTIITGGASVYSVNGVANAFNVNPIVTTSYSVSGTSTAGCTSTLDAISMVTVNATPTLAVNSGSVCAGQPFTLTASGANVYSVNTVASSGTFVVSPGSTTSYSFTGSSSAGCTNTTPVVSTITVVGIPTIAATTGSICNGSTFTIVPSGATSYSMNGAATTVFTVNPNTTTSYTFSGVNAAGCTSTLDAVSEITVHAIPSINTNSGTICSGQTFTIIPGGASVYSVNGVANAFNVNPTANTSYSVSGTSTAGCTSTLDAISTVTVNATPTLAVNSGSVCSGQPFNLTASGANVYSVNTVASSGTFVVSPGSTTSYSFTGSSSAGCTNTTPVVSTITVVGIPTIAATTGSICNGSTFTIVPSGATSYSMNGAATTVFTVNPNTTTSYTFSGVNAAGCTSTLDAVSEITVHAIPSINTNSGTICSGQTFTIIPGGASVYSVNGVANAFNVNPTANTSYSVSGTSTAGCTSTLDAISTVTVNATPTLAVNSGSVCSGQPFNLTASGANVYSVNTVASSGTFVVSPGSTTSYSFTGSSSAGCTNTTPVVSTITVVSIPTIAATTGSICNGSTFTIVPSGATSYSMNGAATSVFTVNPNTTTSYTFSGVNAAGCTSTLDAVSEITVHAIPSINTNSGTICSGQTFTIIPGGASVYSVNGVANAFNVNPTANTSYSVSGTSTAGCTSTIDAISSVSVNASPTIAATSGSICDGSSFTIVPSGANTYSINGAASSFVVNPNTTTDYSITGVSAAGCVGVNTATSTITVFGIPTIAATSGSICDGSSFIIVPSGAASYSINGAAGSFTVSPNTTTSYSISGISSAGCTSTLDAVSDITVHAIPSLTTNSGTICSGETFTIIPGGASIYSVNGVANNFNVNPLVNTSYTVTGTSTAGCTSTLSAISDVTVNATPTIASTSSVICEGDIYTIVPSGANTYSLNGAATNVFTVNPTASTSYSITGVSIAGCTSTLAAVSDITVNAMPTITVNSGAICVGGVFTLVPGGASTYSVNGILTTNFSFSPAATTDYSVTGTSTAGCSNTVDVIATVTVELTPTLTVNSGAICVGNVFTLVPTGASTYSINNVATTDFTVKPTVNTSYSITGNSSAGCSNTVPVVSTVAVNSLPVVLANATKTTVCLGDSLKLSGSGASTYTWINGNTDNTFVTPTIAATYSVVGTDSNTCSDTAMVAITVNDLPVMTLASNNTLTCDGETFTLVASGANTYTWSNAQTTSAISLSLSATQGFSVSGTGTNGCVSSLSYTQLVTPCSGTIDVLSSLYHVSCRGKNDGKVIVDPVITFTNNLVSYYWSPPELCPTNDCKTIEGLKAGTYSVNVRMVYTVTSTYMKRDSITKEIVILDENAPCDLTIFTGVTPNNDGVNESWRIDNIQLYPNNKVTIFNRWGLKVAEVNGYNNGNKIWPTIDELGTLPSSTYFYLIDLGDGSKPVKGWIELMKN